MPPETAAIEIRGAGGGLLDDPLLLSARGTGGAEGLLWRARFRDDDGRVWQASAATADELTSRWQPAKASTGAFAALQSLRPVRVEVHVEAPDGRSATRAVTRALVGEGVRIRRWREPSLSATLYRPAGDACATVAIDATDGPETAAVASLAAPLLASRGVLALVVPPPRERLRSEDALRTARERLAAVPGAGIEVAVLRALDPLGPMSDSAEESVVPLPPGIAARAEASATAVSARAEAWDALLARLGAQPRAARQRA